MIPFKAKYVCKKCKNTFVKSENDVITTNMTCQECGGSLKSIKMDLVDHLNPLERAKSMKHSAKSLKSLFSKKS